MAVVWRLEVSGDANTFIGCLSAKYPVFVGKPEAATHPLTEYLWVNLFLSINRGDFATVFSGFAGLGSLAMTILGWCGGVNWQLASCHLLTSDPEIVG